jgi:ribonuclease P protein component
MAETLKRPEILRRRRDVMHVRRHGSRIGTRLLTLRYARPPEPLPDNPAPADARRIAFFVPRAIRRAVDRNLLKRRLREVYRRDKDWFPAGFDYLLTAAPACACLAFSELREEARSVAARITA